MIEVAPLADDLPFGARITGVDRAALADEGVCREINAVFEDRGLILFDEVEPSVEMQLAVSRTFGPLRDHAMKAVTRIDPDAAPGLIDIHQPAGSADLFEIEGVAVAGWSAWHYDGCYARELYRAGVLHAVDIPPEGGMTGFADGIQIYQAISPELRASIDGASIVYQAGLFCMNQRFGLPKGYRVLRLHPSTLQFLEEAKSRPRAVHPAIWTRKSGERVLHVSPLQAAGIQGREDAEGDALLEALFQDIYASMRPYWHRWRPGQMVVWDNWRMLHAVSGHDPNHARRLVRTTVEGDYGLGRFEDELAPGPAAARA
jgi:taurine dioxygenase